MGDDLEAVSPAEPQTPAAESQDPIGIPLMKTETAPDEPQYYPQLRLIICCDGTWNTDDLDGRALTNVARIARCIADVDNWENPDPNAPKKRNFISQVVHYQPGVGIGTGKIANGTDALTGRGLSKAIRQAYSFICLNRSVTGDTEVILIGFSRGAFTVRCVAQFMREVGLLTRTGLRHLPRLFRLWKRVEKRDESDKNWRWLQGVKEVLCKWGELTTYEKNAAAVRIEACAVWDTVSAVGIPMPGQIPQIRQKKYRTVDGTIPETIKLAVQALSLDETRRRFKPMVWDDPHEVDQKLIQCWFAGNHSDVGGGNPEITLANLALAWMIGQLTDKVQFDLESLWVTTTTRAWSKPSPFGVQIENDLRSLERFCKVVAVSPVTQALLQSKISWGSWTQKILGGAKPRQRNQGGVHYSVYVFHQLGIANYEKHFLLDVDVEDNRPAMLVKVVKDAITLLHTDKGLQFEGDILDKWAKHELCAHVNIRQARTTAEVIELLSDTGRVKLEEPLKHPAQYEAAVPVSAILSAVHKLANDYNAADKASLTTPVQALNDFCSPKVTKKPKKAKKGDKLGTFTFSIVDPKSPESVETELTVVNGQLRFARTFSLLMGRAHDIHGPTRTEERPDYISPCPKCKLIWESQIPPPPNIMERAFTLLSGRTNGMRKTNGTVDGAGGRNGGNANE